MEANKLEYFRNLLQHEIAGLSVNQEKAMAELITATEPLPDMVDTAASQSDRNFELMIRERERNLIAQMEKAILRIDNGTYGICDDCGEDISERRLIARPVATFCIDCKTKQEQAEKKRGTAGTPGMRSNLNRSFQYEIENAPGFEDAD